MEAAVDAAVASRAAARVAEVVASLTGSDAVDLKLARAALLRLVAALRDVPVGENAFVEAVAADAVERVRTAARAASLEEADVRLRFLLYGVHMGAGDFERAGAALGGARIDSPGAALSDEERAFFFVQAATAYLQADDDVNAERFVQRADEWVHKDGVTWQTLMQYKTCWARVLDAKRRFTEAALRYAELARLPVEQVDEADLLACLEKAVNCIILAPAGPSRQRVMGTLMRDERVGNINVRGRARARGA